MKRVLIFVGSFTSFLLAQEYTGYQHPLLLESEHSEAAMLNPSSLSLDSGIEMGVLSGPYTGEGPHMYTSFSLGWGLRMGINSISYLGGKDCYARFYCEQEHLTATSLAYRLRNKRIQNWAEWFSIGLNYKADSKGRDFWDPGITYYSPNFHAGHFQLGLYSLGLFGNEESIQRTTEVSVLWKSPGRLFFAGTGVNLYGDNLSTELLFVKFPRVKKMEFGISPVNWLRLSYLRYPGDFTQYKMVGDWYSQKALFHHLKLELSGGTRDRLMFLSGAVHVGLLGNKRIPNIFKKKKPDFEYDREKYNREKIGVFRGVVWPYVNTFGVYTTFMVPSGTSCLAVGCYTSGFVLMGSWLSMMASVYFIDSNEEGKIEFPVPLVLGFVGTKLIDFFIARHHVKKYNRQLKLKFKTKTSPETGSLQAGGEMQVAF